MAANAGIVHSNSMFICVPVNQHLLSVNYIFVVTNADQTNFEHQIYDRNIHRQQQTKMTQPGLTRRPDVLLKINLHI